MNRPLPRTPSKVEMRRALRLRTPEGHRRRIELNEGRSLGPDDQVLYCGPRLAWVVERPRPTDRAARITSVY